VSEFISIPSGAINRKVDFEKLGKIMNISIPSGAIKRPTRNYLDRRREISIPSGAIKSSLCSRFCSQIRKISIPSGAIKSVGSVYSLTVFLNISIPSGAIKSKSQELVDALEELFQFLLVRLRENFGIAGAVGFTHFNSFWCD